MDVIIRSRNVDVSEELRTAAHEKLSRLARHNEEWEHAEVLLFEERNPRIADKDVCEVTLRGRGHIIRAKAASPDSMASIDRVVDKLEHQMAKLKTRLLNRSHPRHHGHDAAPTPPVDASAGNGEVVAESGAEAEIRIVRTKQFELKAMTPTEAAHQMEMVAHSFFVFTNADTGVAAVVYRRDDGDVGLIDVQK